MTDGNPQNRAAAVRERLAAIEDEQRSLQKDVAAAGGWKDISTLLEVYQQSDEESVLAVTSVTVKLRERGVAWTER